jgi:hypothetical protein
MKIWAHFIWELGRRLPADIGYPLSTPGLWVRTCANTAVIRGDHAREFLLHLAPLRPRLSTIRTLVRL